MIMQEKPYVFYTLEKTFYTQFAELRILVVE